MCDHHLPSMGECGSPYSSEILMVNPVRRHPENRSAFERQGRAPGQEILHPLWRLVSTMGQQPVIAHADSQAARNPPQENGDEKCFPGKEK